MPLAEASNSHGLGLSSSLWRSRQALYFPATEINYWEERLRLWM
jgi:hypothetical protein